ncbi:MAG: hypothetical protein U5L45_11825 [Saprospiraceae bacterium]|nr:hypothetical protein [Saprospiraceae bacterium]
MTCVACATDATKFSNNTADAVLNDNVQTKVQHVSNTFSVEKASLTNQYAALENTDPTRTEAVKKAIKELEKAEENDLKRP